MVDAGRIVWFELQSTDVKGAIAFYTEVTGWSTQAFGDNYTMWVTPQGPVGGVSTLPEQARQMGATPYWQSNVVVADVDASIEKAKELGGKIYHVESVPEIGRFAVIGDPQGAVLAMFTPTGESSEHDLSKPGEFSWHELFTTDKEAAFSFYTTMFGWQKLGEHDMGPMGTYWLWGRNGKQLGGMMTMPPGMKSPDGRVVPPSWMYYVTIADFDAAFERAKAKGATVITGPMDVPGGQRVVQLLDPQGAAFALVSQPGAS